MLEGDILDEGGLSGDQKAVLDSRMAEYEDGAGKSYSWDETVSIAKQELKSRKNAK